MSQIFFVPNPIRIALNYSKNFLNPIDIYFIDMV